jgi:hypothetical protein
MVATATETAKVTAGDIGGGGGDTAIAATATDMAVRWLQVLLGVKSHRGKESETAKSKSYSAARARNIIYTNNGWGVNPA